MSWNYRVVVKGKGSDLFYSIHDVYYDDNKDIVNIGRESPVIGEDFAELKWGLEKMLEACNKPILVYNMEEA